MRLPRWLCSLLVVVALVSSPIDSTHAAAGKPQIVGRTWKTSENITLKLNPAFSSNSVELTPALFGVAHYGTPITGMLVYSTPGNRDGCRTVHPDEAASWPIGQPFIMLVDRGNCSFEAKARHAQSVGALAAILVDQSDEKTLPYLAPGGNSDDITIPSVLIHRADGEQMKKYMCSCAAAIDGADYSQHKIEATLEFGIGAPTTTARWSIWTSADDANSAEFKREFAPVAAALGSKAAFAPNYFIRSGKATGCAPHGQFNCAGQCTNNGR